MKSRGQTLVASLIVIAIILVCVVIFLKGTGDTKPIAKADGRGQTTLGNARATAADRSSSGRLRESGYTIRVPVIPVG